MMIITSFIQVVEFMEGGIAPTLGSCNFAKTKYILELQRINEDEIRKLKSKQ